MTATALRLQTRESRKRLPPRDKPYFLELRRGLALGYRRGTEGGSWLLREYRGNRYVQRRLGAADDDTPADGVGVLSWPEAQTKALGGDRPTVTHPSRYTVDEAGEDYFTIRTKKSDTAGDQLTYKASIKAEREGIPKLGDRSICELTTGELKRWLAALVPETADREERRRAQATANRHWNLLRAILNSAYENEPDRVPSADAWRRVRPYENVDRPRTRTITAAEARELIKALQPPLRALAQASLYTGLRLGEILALRAQDSTGKAIHVRHSKSGRSRSVPLTDEGVEFFKKAAGDKTDGDRLFEPVSRINVSRGMRAACTAAAISPPATFHDLRRSYGSLLLNSGAPADAIQELLGHADLRMTRRAYAHMLDKTLRRAVIKHLPSFAEDVPPTRHQ
jgi:integrase